MHMDDPLDIIARSNWRATPPQKLAREIIDKLDECGYVIVRKEPPTYMDSHARTAYRMNISIGKAA